MNLKPPNSPPKSPPSRWRQGLTTIEMLLATTISVVGVGLLTVAITNNLRDQTEQGQNSNAKNSLRRIVDNLNNEVQNGSMVAVRNATSNRASILFIEEANRLNVMSASNFESGSEIRFSSGSGQFVAGDEVVMVNTNGDAVLLTVSENLTATTSGGVLKHVGCPNTITFTPGTRAYKANTFSFGLGANVAPSLNAQSLYQRVGGGEWEELAFDMQQFNLRYGYTANDGSTAENLESESGTSSSNFVPGGVEKDGKTYRLTSLSLQMAQSGGANRTYNAVIPLQSTRLQINSIKGCGMSASRTGTNGGGLGVVINRPDGVAPNVQVAGPDGFNRTITSNTPDAAPWNNLKPGRYTVTADPITIGGATWTPSTIGNPADVTSWSGSTIIVNYGPNLQDLTMEVTGVPDPLKVRVTLNGESVQCVPWADCYVDGDRRTSQIDPSDKKVFNINPAKTVNVAPGTYRLAFSNAQDAAGNVYIPVNETEAVQSVTMTGAAQTIRVAYKKASAGLLVQYQGNAGSTANINVAGPSGFNQNITLNNGETRSFPGITPGRYVASGTTSSGNTLPALIKMLPLNTVTTMTLSDAPSQYRCPNGSMVPDPSECPRCPDGSLFNGVSCPTGSPKCPDGSPMPPSGVCTCPDGSAPGADGSCPVETYVPDPSDHSCQGNSATNTVMCIDGRADQEIGQTVVIVNPATGERVTVTATTRFEDPICLGSVCRTVEELLSDYPTVAGDIRYIANVTATYSECRDYSCIESRERLPKDTATPGDTDTGDTDTGGTDTGYTDTGYTGGSDEPPANTAPTDPPPTDTPPLREGPDIDYSPFTPYLDP